jgi:hypothetical protein
VSTEASLRDHVHRVAHRVASNVIANLRRVSGRDPHPQKASPPLPQSLAPDRACFRAKGRFAPQEEPAPRLLTPRRAPRRRNQNASLDCRLVAILWTCFQRKHHCGDLHNQVTNLGSPGDATVRRVFRTRRPGIDRAVVVSETLCPTRTSCRPVFST